jgi:hypothetical protein
MRVRALFKDVHATTGTGEQHHSHLLLPVLHAIKSAAPAAKLLYVLLVSAQMRRPMQHRAASAILDFGAQHLWLLAMAVLLVESNA